MKSEFSTRGDNRNNDDNNVDDDNNNDSNDDDNNVDDESNDDDHNDNDSNDNDNDGDDDNDCGNRRTCFGSRNKNFEAADLFPGISPPEKNFEPEKC